MSDSSVAAEIGRRVRRSRLRRNVTQRNLASQAGIGRTTLLRLEAGEDVSMSTVVAVLRALNALDALDAILPEPEFSPLNPNSEPDRQRARPREPAPDAFVWGDER